jgi:hypothetical protein
MPPKKAAEKDTNRVVEIEVNNIPVVYNEATRSFNTGVAAGPDDQIVVLAFAETWQNESGILTVAVVHG